MIINARFLSQPVTGVQRHAIEICRALKAMRPNTILLSPGKIVNREAADLLQPIAVGSSSGYYWEQVELPRFMKKNHPGELLINLANMAPVYYRPKIVTIHDTAPLRHPEWYSKRFSLVYRLMLPRVARTSEVIVTDSEFSRSEICSMLGLDDAMVEVINCAVPQALTQATAVRPSDIPQPYILSVASLEPRKNLTRLLDAFRLLDLPEYRLVVVGAFNSAVFADRGIRDRVEGHDNVTMEGAVDDARLRGLYAGAELFVYPSLYEGFGLPPLEAMASGCPCLVSHSASLPEICGDAAEYCDPLDSADMAAKMRSLLADKNKMNDLRIRGQKRAAEFSWQRSAEKLIKIADRISGR